MKGRVNREISYIIQQGRRLLIDFHDFGYYNNSGVYSNSFIVIRL